MDVTRAIREDAFGAHPHYELRPGYAKLYQTGEPDPVFDPEPDARSYDCTGKTDVTNALIRELDANL